MASAFFMENSKKKMKDKIKAIETNLRILLKRFEGLQIDKPDYGINAKLRKVELKVDEINDLLTEIEAMEEL